MLKQTNLAYTILPYTTSILEKLHSYLNFTYYSVQANYLYTT
jgi:hypothetical protein